MKDRQRKAKPKPRDGRASGLALPVSSLLAATVVITLLALTGPLYTLEIYDRVLPAQTSASLLALTALAVAFLTAFAALEHERGRLVIRLVPSLAAHLDARDKERLGELARRNVPGHALDLAFAPAYAVLAITLHWSLGTALLASAAALAATTRALTRKRRASSFAPPPTADALCSAALSAWHANETRDRFAAYDEAQAANVGAKLVRLLSQTVMLGLGAWLAVEGVISAGSIMAVSVITTRALSPIEPVIVHRLALLEVGKALLSRNGACRFPASATASNAVMPEEKGLSVDISGPLVRPEAPHTRLVFRLARGDALGIIGTSGSGKSHLLATIWGDPSNLGGTLRLDGHDLRGLPSAERERRIGYLPQMPSFQKSTLSAVISRFDPNPGDLDLINAARLARIETFISELPRAFDTEIDPNLLSPGLRQRLALARAVYRTPDVVLFDEPFCHMDAEGDQAVLATISSLRASGSIVLVVAHRLSAFEPLNLVLALKDGRQHLFGPKESAFRLIPRDGSPSRRDAS